MNTNAIKNSLEKNKLKFIITRNFSKQFLLSSTAKILVANFGQQHFYKGSLIFHMSFILTTEMWKLTATN